MHSDENTPGHSVKNEVPAIDPSRKRLRPARKPLAPQNSQSGQTRKPHSAEFKKDATADSSGLLCDESLEQEDASVQHVTTDEVKTARPLKRAKVCVFA